MRTKKPAQFSDTLGRILGVTTPLAGLGLLVALAFFVNALFASLSSRAISQPQLPSSQPVSPTPPIDTGQTDPTAGWQVYRNEKYGFEVRYPPEVEESRIRYTEHVLPDFENEPPRLFRLEIPYSSRFFIEAIEDPLSPAMEDLKEKHGKSEFILLGGTKGLRRNEPMGQPPGGGGPEDMVYLPKESKVYLLYYIVDRESFANEENAKKYLKEQKAIFDQLLSTFKFTR